MISLTRVKQATAQFIKVLRFGESDVQTSDQYLPFGIDSKPVKDMLALHAKTANREDTAVFGYLIESAETEEGETRIYSMDSAGVAQFYIKLFKTGICEIGGSADFMVRFTPLESAMNSLTSFLNTELGKIATGIAAGGGSYTPGTANIDISGAKIDEVKTL